MRVALLGDIALIGQYDRTLNSKVDRRFDQVKRIIEMCDHVVANLESPLTSRTSTRVCKGIHLRSDPLNVKTLKYLRISAVNLANNHIFDYGVEGLTETINLLEEHGIRFYGINNGVCYLESGEDRVALDGFCCYSANGVNYGSRNGQVAILCEENLERSLSVIDDKGYYGIVSAHFGDENVSYPRIDHIRLFRTLAKKHHFCLHGHHPHVLQGVEYVSGGLLAYSLGNFAFGAVGSMAIRNFVYKLTEKNRRSAVLILEISRNRLVGHRLMLLTDRPAGIVVDEEKGDRLGLFSEALKLDPSEYEELRKQELRQFSRECQSKRDVRFFLDRLSLYYIGAYLNGMNNARKYSSVFKSLAGARDEEK